MMVVTPALSVPTVVGKVTISVMSLASAVDVEVQASPLHVAAGPKA
jgi:hypothetical protein